MKNIIGIIGLIAILSFSNACQKCEQGKGKKAEKTFQIEAFDEITIDIPGRIIINNSNAYGIKIECDENLVDLFEFDVKRKSLHLKSNKCIDGFTTLNVEISGSNIEKITVNGNAALYTKGILTSKDFDLEINGTGNAKLTINCEDLDTEINGLSKLELKGQADTHKLTINGNGTCNSADMITQEMDLSLNGAGYCKVSAIEKLDIEINGAGTVAYKGNPAKISTEINGIGKVEALDK